MKSKVEFLKQAMTKFKAQNEGVTNGADYKSEMNFIYSQELILRVYISLDGNRSVFCHKWCSVESIEDKQELVDKCLEEIKKDVACGDLTAIDGLLMLVPDKLLQDFLPEKL